MFGSNRNSPRLAGWDGRKQSSRSDPLFSWGRLRHKAVLARLGIVVAVAAAVTTLVVSVGPPFPYRLGQVVPRDVRARVTFQVVNEAESARLQAEWENRIHAAAQGLPVADPPPTRVPPVVDRYPNGLVLVKRGEPIKAETLTLLKDEHKAYLHTRSVHNRWGRAIGLALVVSLLAMTISVYTARYQPALCGRASTVVGVGLVVAVTLALAGVMNRPPWHAGLVPLTVTAMVLAIAYNPPFALLVSLGLAVVSTLTEAPDLQPLLVQMGGLATAVLTTRKVRTRSRPVQVGVLAGGAFAAMTVAVGLLTEQTTRFVLADAGRSFLWGTVAGLLVSGCLPLIERAFGIVTDVSLVELADNSHPLLQELRVRAPGTYNHSLMVAMLAEAAAEAVGANPLLVRVGAYYHDVGKMTKPDFFVENQSGPNRHNQLEPSLSTLVIVGHVKDGIALAEQYGLPAPVIDFIREHHGTTLVEYFYREALKLHAPDGQRPADLEYTFRYPGPKPLSRETGILMLADAAESASRALPQPTAGNLRRLVHDLLMKRLLDGQFDHSGLTLSDLRLVEDALYRSLISVYHHRIRYDADDDHKKAS